MTVAGIVVTDPDSMDAASDLLEPHADHLCRMAAEQAADHGADPDNDTHDYAWSTVAKYDNPNDGLTLIVSPNLDPEPPSPAAPALPAPVACPSCDGYGRMPMVPPSPFSGAVCWMCNGSGTDAQPAPAVIDRTEHMRRLGQMGGYATLAKYGTAHYRVIGKTGYAITAARHGEQYARDLVRAKGWAPKPPPDLLADLRAGRALADLDRIAA